MELKELKKKNKAELHKVLNESRDKLRDLRFKDANKQLKNVREIRKIRQTIARVLMLLSNNVISESVSAKIVKNEKEAVKK
ncbi:MAG: 50S ribosomal protein L29 [Patescibacteria group bacterium]|nr:50S ribosomal protein L29 [Patescibacteria group bacterium]